MFYAKERIFESSFFAFALLFAIKELNQRKKNDCEQYLCVDAACTVQFRSVAVAIHFDFGHIGHRCVSYFCYRVLCATIEATMK